FCLVNRRRPGILNLLPLNASDQRSKRCIMFTCSAIFALACQIAVWLTNANATLLPPYWRFEPHHIKAIVDTAYEESGHRPCIQSRDGSVGLWQWRDSRRAYLHQKANTPPTTCVPAESQVRLMIDELLTRRE